MKLLEQGNATMGVWLGKQILGQTDNVNLGVAGAQVYLILPSPTAPATLAKALDGSDQKESIALGPADYVWQEHDPEE
jgi:hypothetical protein